MKTIPQKIRFRSRFDFEVGYLVKSPCKECVQRHEFPHCMNRCEMLERIQERLAESISCQRRT